MKIFIYIAYNLVWLRLAVFLLSFLNTYINAVFIPKNFRWTEAGNLRDDLTLFGISQFILTNIEAILFLGLIYLVNKWCLDKYLSSIQGIEKVSTWTAFIAYLVLFSWIFRYYYMIYK